LLEGTPPQQNDELSILRSIDRRSLSQEKRDWKEADTFENPPLIRLEFVE
jgi:hypothetical protein